MLDPVACERVRRYGIPECLRVPIAALDEVALERHVGPIVRDLSGRGPRRAFFVQAHPPPPIDAGLPIWAAPGASILLQPMQVWVHREYGAYRAAYRRAFPDADVRNKVLSHAMNRRLAAIKGFQFVRLTPTSRVEQRLHGRLGD